MVIPIVLLIEGLQPQMSSLLLSHTLNGYVTMPYLFAFYQEITICCPPFY